MSYERMVKAEDELAAEVANWLAKADEVDTMEDAEHGADRRGDETPDWMAAVLAIARQMQRAAAIQRREQNRRLVAQVEEPERQRAARPKRVRKPAKLKKGGAA